MRYLKLKPKNELLKDENGYNLCRYCNNSVKPPRRTICSVECSNEILIRTNHKYMKNCVYKRDKAICCLCHKDTKTIKQELFNNYNNKNNILKKYNISLKRRIYKNKWGGGLWDVDHIKPVKEGGGCCGLDNLRTLCINCHKMVTRNMYLENKDIL